MIRDPELISDLLQTVRRFVRERLVPAEQRVEESNAIPEEIIAGFLENTWADSARSSVGSWVGLVYQVTNIDRKKPFMDGIDPNNPLGIL